MDLLTFSAIISIVGTLVRRETSDQDEWFPAPQLVFTALLVALGSYLWMEGKSLLMILVGFIWLGSFTSLPVEVIKCFAFHKRDPRLYIVLELQNAWSAKKRGDYAEAIRLTKQQLEKDPHHYEGNLLLAELYLDKGQRWPALLAFHRILVSPDLTDEQRAVATYSQKETWQQLKRRCFL